MIKRFINTANLLTKVGLAVAIIANPLFYMGLAALFVDVKNLFGADIDRRIISFDTNDPMIQAMNVVMSVGFILLIAGLLKHRKRQNS